MSPGDRLAIDNKILPVVYFCQKLKTAEEIEKVTSFSVRNT